MDRATGFPVLPAVLVLVAGAFAYFGTWNGEFLFDDLPAISDNVALQAHDFWNAAFGEHHQPLANRPFACLTLVLDFMVFGDGSFGPHLTNLLLHLGNALLLLLTLRGALLAPSLRGRFSAIASSRIATVVALSWVVHPLGVDAVAYATQRSTLLISGFLLVALFSVLRAHGSPRRGAWRVVAVAAVAMGMASKEDMVVAPILVVLFSRAFVLPTWRALREEKFFIATLGATWLVLAACVWAGPVNPTVGVHTPISPWQWLMTQASVIVHYLRLVVWPHPLRGAYDNGVTEFGEAVLPGLLVVVLLVASIRWWWSRPSLGWLGALFFLLLAPTSSVLPIETEIVAERRMYLPMLCVLIPIVVAAYRFVAARTITWRITGGLVVTATVIGLAFVTRDRVHAYGNAVRFWGDAYEKREPGRRTFLAAQILSNQGAMLWQQGRLDEAHVCYEESMKCPSPTAIECMHYAVSLVHRGRQDEGIALLRQVVTQAPHNGEVLGSLGTCLLATHYAKGEPKGDPVLDEAEDALRRSVVLKPKNAAFWNSLGYVLGERGNLPESERAYAKACELTDRIEPFIYRANILERLGRGVEVRPMFERLLHARPTDVQLRLQLAEIRTAERDPASARQLLNEVLRLEPGNTTATAMLRRIEGAH